MQLSRRQFLQGSAALFCAPAIVKAENIMPIYVPPDEIIKVPAEVIVEHSIGIDRGEFELITGRDVYLVPRKELIKRTPDEALKAMIQLQIDRGVRAGMPGRREYDQLMQKFLALGPLPE